MPKMNDIQCGTDQNLYGNVAHTAKESKSIKCGNLAELSPRQAEALECCKKHEEALNLFLNGPALAADFYPKCCFFITCIVARVFLLQCVAASKTN